MRAEAVLEPVEDRTKQELGLHVPEASLRFEEVFVAKCDVFGADLGITGTALNDRQS
ncbi:hypothetical protein GCM10022419_081370 [Nonomuraea rosea]|uniref:Uncharacterized protein n=1 Tax=Nonomuraea rosea TaxID=638574 RepID=A0ABP6YNG6_9ACTN